MKKNNIRVFAMGIKGFPGVQGGIQKISEELFPRLVQLGYDVTALTIRGYSPLITWRGVRFVQFPTIRKKGLEKLVYNLFATFYCLLHRPDVVHIHSIASGTFLFILKLFGLRVVTSYCSRDYLYPKWGRLAKWVLRWGEWNFLLADYNTCVSQAYFDYFRSYYRCRKVARVPLGITFFDRKTVAERGRVLLESLGLEQGRFVLGVGRLVPEKGFETLIAAFRRCKATGPHSDLKLVIVGDEDQKTSYGKNLRGPAEEHDDIVFTGRLEREKVYELYASCGLYVLSSRHEGLPNVLLEALGFGCNILASNIESAREIDLEESSYFTVDDADDLAGKMGKVFDRRIESRDYTHLRNDYDWMNIARQVDHILRQVVGRSPSPGQ